MCLWHRALQCMYIAQFNVKITMLNTFTWTKNNSPCNIFFIYSQMEELLRVPCLHPDRGNIRRTEPTVQRHRTQHASDYRGTWDSCSEHCLRMSSIGEGTVCRPLLWETNHRHSLQVSTISKLMKYLLSLYDSVTSQVTSDCHQMPLLGGLMYEEGSWLEVELGRGLCTVRSNASWVMVT